MGGGGGGGVNVKQLLLLLLSVLGLVMGSTAATFNCSVAHTCEALIDFVSPVDTNFSHIQALFGVKNLRNLLGANNLRDTTPKDTKVFASQTIRIPFRCLCANGTGTSNGRPVYTVKKDDGLDFIAVNAFGRLVTYQEIAAANGIPDPNKIVVGQKLRIPLPCTCDTVNNDSNVLHYGLVVKQGSSVAEIAQQYGADPQTLLRLNGLADPNQLKASTVFDVPLRACSSNVRKESLDYPLLIPNNTYRFTAQNCIKCKCDAASNWTLQCDPTTLHVAANSSWSTCPAVECEGTNLSLGNSSFTNVCEIRTCTYAGYNNATILSSLSTAPACPASASPPADNHAAKMYLEGPRRSLVFIYIHVLVLLSLLVH